MKKLFGILIIFALIIGASYSALAQSSTKLNKEWKKERAKMAREGASPEEIQKLDEKYEARINKATEIENYSRAPRPTGSSIEFQGDQGSFSGRSLSVTNGANAYATVTQADANAYMTRKMADGNSATISAPNNKMGLEGLIVNKYRYQGLIVEIKSIDPGNSFKKKYTLAKGQQLKEYLLPGKYQATVSTSNSQPSTQVFEVVANRTNNYEGNSVFWYVAGGSDW